MATRFTFTNFKHLLIVIIFTLCLIGYGYCSVTTLKSSRRCLPGCQCKNEDIAFCTSLPTDFSDQYQYLNKIILKNPNCNCEFARWYHWITSKNIKIEGICSQPRNFFNKSIQLLPLGAFTCFQDKENEDLNHRLIRSNNNQQPPYQFTTSPIYSTKCDFQQGLCQFRQIRNADTADWNIKQGSTKFPTLTGPRVDHTYGTAKGKYLYMDSLSNLPNSIAEIISPPLIIANQVNTVNIVFYYQLYGRDVAGIRVHAIYAKYNLMKEQIWEKRYNRGPYWIKANFLFSPTYPEYQAINGGVYGDVAIDDVFISPAEINCYSGSNYGIYYRGFTQITQGRLLCDRWSAILPANNLSQSYENQLEGSYCRNPDGKRSKPWCYTIDASIRWGYCNIPQCQPRLPLKPTSLPGNSIFTGHLPISIASNNLLALFRRSVWGTVCASSNWTNTVSTTICKQLGISSAGVINVIKLNKAYEGNPSWYFPVECTGLENSLQQCKSDFSNAQSLQNCNDDYAYGVDCVLPVTAWPTPNPIEYNSILTGGKSLAEGYLQIYSGSTNSFTTICSTANDSRPLAIADVMCREQGFLYALSTKANLKTPVVWPHTSWVYNLRCTGFERRIYRCQQRKYDNVEISPKCDHKNDLITAKCKTDDSNLDIDDPGCDFEKGFCGWDYKHRIPFTSIAYWVYKDDSSGGHFDPISKLQGNYIYSIQGPSWTSGSSAALVSPPLQIEKDDGTNGSVTFKYYVNGQNFQKIQVLIKNAINVAAETKILWSQEISNQQIGLWITQTVPIQSSTDFKILIVAYSKYIDYNPSPTPPLTAIALDDITFKNVIKKRDKLNVVPIILVVLGIGAIVITLLAMIRYFNATHSNKTVVVTNDVGDE